MIVLQWLASSEKTNSAFPHPLKLRPQIFDLHHDMWLGVMSFARLLFFEDLKPPPLGLDDRRARAGDL